MEALTGGDEARPQRGDEERAPTMIGARTNMPYNLRSGVGSTADAAPGAGAAALPGQAGEAGARDPLVFHGVDTMADESGEEYTDVRYERGDSDQSDAQSLPFVPDLSVGGSLKRRPGTGRKLPIVTEGGVEPIQTKLFSRQDAEKRSAATGHRHTPPPVFADMTWEELEAYRKIHLEFQRRALEKHAGVASRGNELLIRGDLPSPVEDGQVTGGRTVPGSSDYFGAAATNPGTRRRTSRVAGQSSDIG